MNEVRLTKSFFNEISRHSISQYLGEALSLVDTIENKNDLKKEIKEHAFQFQRHVWDKLESFSKGYRTKVTINFEDQS